MKKIIATNFILVLFLVCFMAGGVNADPDTGSNGPVTNGTVQVPEPSSLLMLGSGLIGVCALVKKIKNK
jgi:hypothetical protein